jgi:translocation and assembly module TamB
VSELARGPLHDAVLEADLVAERGVLRGVARMVAPRAGRLLMRAHGLELPRHWQPSSFASIPGQLELRGHADLAQLARVQGLEVLAQTGLQGTLDARLELLRERGGEPRVRVALAARDLTGALPRAGAESRAAGSTGELARSRWQGFDLDLRLDLDGSELRVRAGMVDDQGRAIASLRGATTLPLSRILREPASFDPRAQPMTVQLQIPERRLAEFPASLRVAGVDGRVRAEASIRGRLGRPELTGHLALSELRVQGRQAARPLAIDVDAALRDDQLRAHASARNEGRQLVSLQAEAALDGGERPRWHDLAVELHSNGLPLEAIGALLGQDVGGDLYGAVSLSLATGAPRAKGTLWVNEPSVRGFEQRQARWVIDAGPDAFAAELALEQRGGRAHAALSGPWRWSDALTPTLDRRLVRGTIRAERFDLRAFSPLLPEQTRDLRGRLDAKLRVDPGQPGILSGAVALREGSLYVAALGQEFREIALDARLGSSERLTIERLSARASHGRITAQGSVELDGLAFRDAELDVNIPRGDPLPLAIEGVTVASAWGRLDVSARQEPAASGEPPGLRLKVRVPRLQVLLPELSPSSIQELAEDPTISAGTYLSPEHFVPLPLPPYDGTAGDQGAAPGPVVRADLELGSEVWVEQEPLLEVKLTGGVSVELRDQLTVTGQLQLARGSIDVQGRTFQIEQGEISFVESRDPTNPTLVATGVYTAPEGTRVYAEFVGPVETGKLTLRSEPPLRDDQILSLLLFGSSDGSFGSSSGASEGDALSRFGGTALVAGGNLFARGLNLELRRLTSLDIQTRIGEHEGEPQPEVAVQLTPRVTAELAYRLEAPTPGRAPDRSYLTLDLRLFRNWSLSTTIGDAGSFLLDLLWRYRY